MSHWQDLLGSPGDRGSEVILEALKVRLADAGMFEAQEQKHDAERKEKKKGHKFHLRNKHKRKDAFKGIRGPREDESTASESLNSIQASEADNTSDMSMLVYVIIMS